jgi:membrane fusion protein (multidrug efflux system)
MARRTFKAQMDQRVDNDSRTGLPSGRDVKSAGAAPRRSWRDTLRERRGLVMLIAIITIVSLIAVLLWWLHARQYESTDDAFIDARTVQVSSHINAAIVDVPVDDNQLVEKGTVLVRLDDRDYVAQRDQAAANVANLNAQIAAQQAKIEQAAKQVTQAEAALTFAQQQDDRYQQLSKQGTATVEQAQQYKSNLLQSQASYAAAQANAVATEKQVPVLQAQLQSAQAQLETAQINLSRTIITAPLAGRVTHLTAAKGNWAATGSALMMFVPREVWVTANFKETQLDLMRPGQPVDIDIDAYPDKTFRGHVDSIQSGSGTAFSLLPAENATGNFVKIVQRVPVKIVFDNPPDVLLGPGISVVPTVKVR